MKIRAPLASISMALFVLCAIPAAQAQESAVETAALRCSAVSLLHSSLTVPSPQFGEVMTQIAGLFAEIYSTQVSQRTKAKLAVADLKARRDAVLGELRKGWPGNKDKVIRDAAACNAWRGEFFAKLPEKPTEKQFMAALAQTTPPTAAPAKADIDKWTKLTTEAMGAAAAMNLQPPKK
jgi:hypothetical protein